MLLKVLLLELRREKLSIREEGKIMSKDNVSQSRSYEINSEICIAGKNDIYPL